MSKMKRKSSNIITSPQSKEIYNPFLDLSQASFYERQTKKSPKISKKVGKCFQLMLICQKILKPFSSSSKPTQQMVPKYDIGFKEKSRSIQEISCPSRITEKITALQTMTSDACVQTNNESLPDITQIVLADHYPNIKSREERNACDLNDSTKDQYWDLDIDSAIVGDYNSMSGLSLDEEIDPHYTTIQVSPDGRVLEKPMGSTAQIQYAASYQDEKMSCVTSNASSPKSGVYSRIIKPRKGDDFDVRMGDYIRQHTSSRLNFETIMAIRTKLGLSRDLGQYYHSSECSVTTTDRIYSTETPDIPHRTYGSSVVNYITKLRLTDPYPERCRNIGIGVSPSVIGLDDQLSSANIYSPIWLSDTRASFGISEVRDTPGSEPIAPKRSMNKILHQLNPTYRDDSSEDASCASFNSPLRMKFSYPRYFSDDLPKTSVLDNQQAAYINLLSQDTNRFRHMDSELDINTLSGDRSCQGDVQYHRGMEVIEGVNVPLDIKEGYIPYLCDEKWFLQPLMERSCEEDYFRETCYHL